MQQLAFLLNNAEHYMVQIEIPQREDSRLFVGISPIFFHSAVNMSFQ